MAEGLAERRQDHCQTTLERFASAERAFVPPVDEHDQLRVPWVCGKISLTLLFDGESAVPNVS